MNEIIHIKSKTKWYEINFKEIFKYKDLIFLFTKRNYFNRYKQTVLGPLWLIINPLVTVLLFSFVFGTVGKIPTGGIPPFLFFLSGNVLWTFFSNCILMTSKSLIDNAPITGKIYFPRFILPITSITSAMIDLAIQLGLFLVALVIYIIIGFPLNVDIKLLLLFPILIIQVGLLGLGCGLVISSLTTKYRDLAIFINSGIQVWMYISPVIYSISSIPSSILNVYLLNPMAPVMTLWRTILFGSESIPILYWMISWGVTFTILIIGIGLFNKVEKIFLDTV